MGLECRGGGDEGGDVPRAIFREGPPREGRGIVEYVEGFRQSPGFRATPGPRATMRSTAARARAAVSGGTDT